MIHSHWLCYKYFYGSVFLFLFSFPFFQRLVDEPSFQDLHNWHGNHRMWSWRGPLSLAGVLPQILQVRKLDPRGFGNSQEVMELVSGWCWTPGLLELQSKVFCLALSFSPVWAKGWSLDGHVFSVRPQPWSLCARDPETGSTGSLIGPLMGRDF